MTATETLASRIIGLADQLKMLPLSPGFTPGQREVASKLLRGILDAKEGEPAAKAAVVKFVGEYIPSHQQFGAAFVSDAYLVEQLLVEVPAAIKRGVK